MTVRILAVTLLLLPLSGCMDLFGPGCWDEGGTAVWHQDGIHDALAATAEKSGFQVTATPADDGVAIDHSDSAVRDWNGSLAYLRLDEGDNWILLDLSLEPPKVRAFIPDDDAGEMAHRFLSDLVAADADLAGWVAAFENGSIDDRGGRQGPSHHAAALTIDLDLQEGFREAFIGITLTSPSAPGTLTFREDDGRSWAFSVPHQEVWEPGRSPVHSNGGDFVFVALLENPEDDADARATAEERLAGYGVEPDIGEDFTFHVQQVCT